MLSTALAIMAASSQLSGQSLLDDLSHRAVNFFWHESNPQTGLAKDRAANFADHDEYKVASVASTGYALAAYAIGVHRGWIPRRAALERTKLTLHFLQTKALRTKGWFVHFIDWSNGERVWNSEVSSIDTSILISGMIVAKGAFNDPEVSEGVDRLMADIDWKWMLTDGGTKPNETSVCMGYTPEHGFIKARWDSLSEEMMLYIQALGSWSGMPAASWRDFKRNPFTYKGREEIIGGPLFMHEMSQGFLPFKGKRDGLGYDYSIESRNAILNCRQYCIDNPKHWEGYSANTWGLTPCDTPTGYGGNGQPGLWGADDGTLAPTCAIEGMDFTPKQSLEAAEGFYTKHREAYGRYGFSNGINPTANWHDPDVIGIDLGMMMLGIENARDGFPNRMSWKSEIVRRGFQRAGFHSDTNEGPFEQRALKR